MRSGEVYSLFQESSQKLANIRGEELTLFGGEIVSWARLRYIFSFAP